MALVSHILLIPQVFERHKDVLEHLILVSIEGFVRDWEWNGVNSITTPYFGAVHWHRGKRQQDPSLEDIIASKQHFALLSAKIRHYDGKLRFQHHTFLKMWFLCALQCFLHSVLPKSALDEHEPFAVTGVTGVMYALHTLLSYLTQKGIWL